MPNIGQEIGASVFEHIQYFFKALVTTVVRIRHFAAVLIRETDHADVGDVWVVEEVALELGGCNFGAEVKATRQCGEREERRTLESPNFE